MALTQSFYDALLVGQDATLDEIKQAFKKRALQVHPDKGGSKKAFHLVYAALETLADPEARRKYDHGLAVSLSGNVQPTSGRGGRKKASKCGQPTEPKQARSKQKARNSTKGADGIAGSKPAPAAPQSAESKLLTKIFDLLKQLPRDVRNDVISKEFSQKQRLILEKWIVDASSAAQGGKQVGPVTVATQNSAGSSGMIGKRSMKEMIHDTDITDAGSCNDLAVEAASKCSVASKTPARRSKVHRIRNKKEKKKRVRNACGSLHKNTAGRDPSYSGRICFDSVELSTRYTDLQTALEFLVILTSVKQRMQDAAGQALNFEERLHASLVSSATEHGRNLTDLGIRFAVNQRAGFFIGKQFMLKSPCVRNIEAFKKLRGFLDPFRAYARKHLKGAKIFSRYSLAHLQEAWERFQQAVADAWELAGSDSTNFMQKVRASYQATAPSRQRHLQSWERQQMAIQDKNKYRPKRLQDCSTKHLERREQQGMAREDKNQHRPRALRERSTRCLEHRERQQMAMNDKNRHRPRRLRFSSRNRLLRMFCRGNCRLWSHCLWDGSTC